MSQRIQPDLIRYRDASASRMPRKTVSQPTAVRLPLRSSFESLPNQLFPRDCAFICATYEEMDLSGMTDNDEMYHYSHYVGLVYRAHHLALRHLRPLGYEQDSHSRSLH